MLVFLHPKCSCSEATVGELDKLLGHAPNNVDTLAVFAELGDQSHAFAKGRLWRRTAAIPGVRVIRDARSEETRRFGVQTSGQVELFDSRGKLVFSGGITQSRGHMGDNLGTATILEILAGRTSTLAKAAVFGCGLFQSLLAKDI